MQVSLMPEAAAEDGEVNYRLSLDDALAAEKAMSSSGIAATPAGKLKLPPRRIPQEKKPVKIHCHTRIFCVGEISAVRSTFECRFDLYVHWPEQVIYRRTLLVSLLKQLLNYCCWAWELCTVK